MPPPVIATAPFAGWVTEATLFGPPSTSVSLASTSIALAPESSVTVAASLTAAGGSSTLVRLIVIVAVPDCTGVPLSVTCTVRLNVGVVSKSTAAELATVITPVAALIAKAPPVLPAVIEKAWVCPASWSVKVTVPAVVPFGLFSGSVKVAGLTTGALLTSVTLTVIVAVPDSAGVPLSVTCTVSEYEGVVVKLSWVESATVICPVAELIAKALPVLPAVIAKVWVCPASGSVKVTVPTLVPFGAFSGTAKVAGLTTGASLTSVRLTVIVAVPDIAGEPLSVTCTVRLNVGVVSKSSAAELATVITPVVASIAKAVPVFPPVIAKAWVCPASESVKVTVPTLVAFGLFSGSEKVAALTTGAWLTIVTLTVIVAVPDSAGVPLSVTCTVSEYEGVVVKLSWVESATVICPVAELIAKALPVLPAVIAKVWVCPASGSVKVTVPTLVPFGAFSGTAKVAGLTTGASLTSVRLTVIVAVPDIAGEPLSVTCTVRLNAGVVSKSRAAELATVICPVAALIAKAPPVFPAVIAKACVCPASGSVKVTVPTLVAFGLFSGIEKVAGLTTGALFVDGGGNRLASIRK